MTRPWTSRLRSALGLAWLFAILALTSRAEAQLSIDNVPETLIEAFRFHLDKWSEVLLGFAKKLFFALASIELTMSLARAYYEEGGTFDRIGAVFIHRMLFLGFWSTLLFFGPDGIRNLVDTFAALGASASGQALDPTGILEQGLGLTLELMSLAFDEGVLESAALFFPLTILAMVFVFATAEVVGALIDAYIVASAGIVMLGFGGSRWTAPMAENYLRTAVGAGIHLMVVNLVAAVGMRAVLEIAYVIKGVGDADFPGLVSVVLYVTGAAMLFAYLLRRVPAMVSSIATGAVAADSGNAVVAAAASGAHMGVSAAMMTAAPVGRFASNLAATASAALQGRPGGNPEHPGAGVSAATAARPAQSSFNDSMKPSAAIQKGDRRGDDDAV
jgi:type IV secretion system protein TrbL